MIPRRYKDVSIADVPANVLDFYSTLRDTRMGIYIYGGVGVGKTHIAYALYKDWIEKRKNEVEKQKEEMVRGVPSETKVRPPAHFWNMTELLFNLRNEFRTSGAHEVSSGLMEAQNLLFLDDVGAERVTEWVEEVFYLTVNNYYENEVPIIFTSNYPLSGIAEKVGERIASRIKEMCHVIELKGEDRRLKI